MKTHITKRERVPTLCACGCGLTVEQKPGSGRPKKWLFGHKPKSVVQATYVGRFQKGLNIKCECGCGEILRGHGNRRWIAGHKPSVEPPKRILHSCNCGCGEDTGRKNRKWIPGHEPAARKFCACGCGLVIAAGTARKWLAGHRVKPPKTTPCNHLIYPACGCTPAARGLGSRQTGRGKDPNIGKRSKRKAKSKDPEGVRSRQRARLVRLIARDPEGYKSKRRANRQKSRERKRLLHPKQPKPPKPPKPARPPRWLRQTLYITFLRLTSWLACLGMGEHLSGSNVNDSSYLVYGLIDPRTRLISYIGQSTLGLCRPHQHHAPNKTRRNSWCSTWLRGLERKHLRCEIVVLEVTEADQSLLDTSEIWWIRYGRLSGWPLKNMTDGGIGSLGRKHNRKTKALITTANTGRRLSAVTRMKISVARRKFESEKLKLKI